MQILPISLARPARQALLVVAIALGGCASLPENAQQQTSFAYSDTADTSIGKYIRDDLAAHPGKSGFHLLSRGLDAFAARAIFAYSAERSIDAQYYLWHNDLVGKLLVDALLKAADRGVRVRLLVDDMALDTDKDIGVAALDLHPNVEIRVFNPFARQGARWLQFVSRFDKVTRRMHNKSFTVDNQISIVGGRNIGNEYFEADPSLDFADLDTITVGPVVAEVSQSFDQYWNSPVSYPIATLLGSEPNIEGAKLLGEALHEFVEQQRDSEYLQALRASDLVEQLKAGVFKFHWGNARVFYDDPAKVSSSREETDLHLASQLKSLNAEVGSELIIFSPYFIPGREGVENLRKLRQRGVRVRILTNSLASTDVSAVHAGYSKYRRYLLRDGVELYEIDKTLTRQQRKEKKGVEGSSKASLHTKSFVIDRRGVFIGSMNLDPRSVVENTEIGVLFESTDIAGEMGRWFDRHIEDVAFRLALEEDSRGEEILVWYRDVDGVEQRYTKEPNTGFWRRFGVGFLTLLPIEWML